VIGIGLAAITRLPVSRAWPLALSLLVWLPYLPGRVPAAFLMWQGPLEGLVWIAIAAGLLFAARSRPCGSPAPAPTRGAPPGWPRPWPQAPMRPARGASPTCCPAAMSRTTW